jgi:hypothetical protein
MSRQRNKKGLGARFKGVRVIKAGGIYCYCCNSYKGSSKALPGRMERRASKLDLKNEDA